MAPTGTLANRIQLDVTGARDRHIADAKALVLLLLRDSDLPGELFLPGLQHARRFEQGCTLGARGIVLRAS
ncbi:MAG: hypothetical protein V2J51_15390 [Erythrobacter sp.]|nr:hypothetical protein [Erythrobacter sp.]